MELDFTRVKVFASTFFNSAIGQLLKDISPPDDLNRLLRFTNLNSNGQTVLKWVITNAKRYYSDQPYQEAVDAVIEEYAASFETERSQTVWQTCFPGKRHHRILRGERSRGKL